MEYRTLAWIRENFPHLIPDDIPIEIEPGWVWLLAGTCEAIELHCHRLNTAERPLLRSVKEKEGRMVIDHLYGDPDTERILDMAELVSVMVCVACGETNELGKAIGERPMVLCRKCRVLDERYHQTLFSPVEPDPSRMQIRFTLPLLQNAWFRNRIAGMLLH